MRPLGPEVRFFSSLGGFWPLRRSAFRKFIPPNVSANFRDITLAWWHVLLKPRQGTRQHIAAMLRRVKVVALVRVDHQLGGHVLGAQCVPELKGLRSRTLPVAIPDYHQRRRLDVMDEVDGR